VEPLRTEPSTGTDDPSGVPQVAERAAVLADAVGDGGHMVGDPQQIRTLAARLRGDADRLRELTRRVGATREVAWRSRAATLFRDRVGERAHALQRSARALDEAARRVDAHADAVEAARAQVVRVAGLGADLARAAGGAVTRAVDGR
jgi:hypothetical protein